MFAIYPFTLHMSCMMIPYNRSTQDMANVLLSYDQVVTTGLLLRSTVSRYAPWFWRQQS